MAAESASFDEFWLHYLRVHAHRRTRQLHYIAITTAIIGVVVGLFVEDYGLIAIAGILTGYAIAWAAHAKVEHNKPAFFDAPVMSFFAAFRMYYEGLVGGLDPHLQRAGVLSEDGRLSEEAVRKVAEMRRH